MSYSRVPLSRERICGFGLANLLHLYFFWFKSGLEFGDLRLTREGKDERRRRRRRTSHTPLLETQTVREEWSNMRIWNGSVTSNVASSKLGGGAPSGLKGPIGTADVRIRAGTLLGNVTTEEKTVVVSVVSCVTSSVTGPAVTVTVVETTSFGFATVVKTGTTYVVVTVA